MTAICKDMQRYTDHQTDALLSFTSPQKRSLHFVQCEEDTWTWNPSPNQKQMVVPIYGLLEICYIGNGCLGNIHVFLVGTGVPGNDHVFDGMVRLAIRRSGLTSPKHVVNSLHFHVSRECTGLRN